MNLNLRKLAAAAVLTLSASAAAHAGSVTQPGESVGIGAGIPLVPGWYFIDTLDWGVRDTAAGHVALGVNIPVVAWATPWKVWGARVQFLAAVPEAETGTLNNANPAVPYVYGFYNPFFAGQLAWDLGGGWGFSYALGTYIGVKTPVGFDSTSINQRFALSYTLNGWNLTGNLIWGIQPDHLTTTINPDFLNLDLTATKKFGNWELGVVGFLATDLNNPCPFTCGPAPAGYAKQSQFGLGPLVGYNFGPVILQTYFTREVAESNRSGLDTRFWGRIIIPVLDPPPAATPSGPVYRR